MKTEALKRSVVPRQAALEKTLALFKQLVWHQIYTVVTREVSTGDKGGVQRRSREDIEAPDLSGDMHQRSTEEKPSDRV